jgi:hypothetical protein
MPRLPELTVDTAPAATQKIMQAQQRALGMMLNPTKIMGYCPTIVEGQMALAQGIEKAGNIEPRLRYMVYTFVAGLNGCPF